MNLKKRTEEQVDQSVKEGDKTGGYNFISWLIWIEGKFIIPLSVIAIIIFIATIYFESLIGTSIVSGLILVYYLLLAKDYKKLKKGIVS